MNKSSIVKRLRKITPPIKNEAGVYFVDSHEEADNLILKGLPNGSVVFIDNVPLDD